MATSLRNILNSKEERTNAITDFYKRHHYDINGLFEKFSNIYKNLHVSNSLLFENILNLIAEKVKCKEITKELNL